MSDSTHHCIDYIEIACTDLAASRAFYAAAFDWSFTEYGPDYLGIKKPGGGEQGGLRGSDVVVPGGPLVVLFSNDLDATLTAVEAAGGRILVPPFAFPGGRRFHFADPSGNALAVWGHPS